MSGICGVSGRRGGSLALTAVMIVALLSVSALAIDLGMLYKVKAETQRAADASALAGASAFLDFDAAVAAPVAENRAREYAAKNFVSNSSVDSNRANREVVVQVLPAEEKVRVWVRREGIQTFFARIFGVQSTAVGAMAAARALSAGETKCVKPFALPDLWNESSQDVNLNRVQDIDLSRGPNDGEQWSYDPPADSYGAVGSTNGTQTGYGSSFRNGYIDPLTGNRYRNDDGRRIPIKMGNPQTTPQPGNFYPWAMPGGTGGDWYRDNIARCNPTAVDATGTRIYQSEPGNMQGPTAQGIADMLDDDTQGLRWFERDLNGDGVIANTPGATGDQLEMGAQSTRGPTNGTKYSPEQVIALNNPRIAIVPMMDPAYVGNGRTDIRFNGFRFMFFEGCARTQGNSVVVDDNCNPGEPVVARFLDNAVPGTGGPATGPLLKYLRLVE